MAKRLRKYTVTLHVEGDANRIVMATSQEDAVAKVKKMLLADDGQTPKTNSLNAFCWDVRQRYVDIHWSDMDPEEREDRREKLLGEKRDETIEPQEGDDHDQG